MLPGILERAYESAYDVKETRRKHKRRARKREQKRKAREEKKKRREKEKQRRNALVEDASQWSKSQDLRAYCNPSCVLYPYPADDPYYGKRTAVSGRSSGNGE
jgi:hypothetical protein